MTARESRSGLPDFACPRRSEMRPFRFTLRRGWIKWALASRVPVAEPRLRTLKTSRRRERPTSKTYHCRPSPKSLMVCYPHQQRLGEASTERLGCYQIHSRPSEGSISGLKNYFPTTLPPFESHPYPSLNSKNSTSSHLIRRLVPRKTGRPLTTSNSPVSRSISTVSARKRSWVSG